MKGLDRRPSREHNESDQVEPSLLESILTGARCARRCVMESMYKKPCGRRRRTCASKRWRAYEPACGNFCEEKRAGDLCFDENMKGEVTNRTQERKDLWEVWAASPAGALWICREKVEGGAAGSWTNCSLEERG